MPKSQKKQFTEFVSKTSYNTQKNKLEDQYIWVAYKMSSGSVEWYRGKVLSVKRSGKIKIQFEIGIKTKIMSKDRTLIDPKQERKTWMFDDDYYNPNDDEPYTIFTNQPMIDPNNKWSTCQGGFYRNVQNIEAEKKKLLKDGLYLDNINNKCYTYQ